MIFQQTDAHLAFVLDEHEHVLDGGPIAIGDQQNLPPEIAVLRLERSERRHLVRMRRDMRLSQFPQIVEQRNRVRAGIEHLAVRLEDDLKRRANRRLPAVALRLAPSRRNLGRRQQAGERPGDLQLSRDGCPFGRSPRRSAG